LNPGNSIQNKILTLPELLRRVSQWRVVNKTIAFTNGCYDILHAGHIASLTEASRQGDYLVVAVNADSSIKGLKGDNRPVNDENARALVVAALSMVDAVIIFPEPTPLDLVVAIRPEVLVKGGDYKVEEIAGAREVISWGGKVVLNPIVEGYSTTSIINKLQNK
jgi:D-glycero-beta-D-manno-heptose 1-phosphate adenylyltransferase